MQVKFNFQIVTIIFVILVFSSDSLLSKSCTKDSECGAYKCVFGKCLTSCIVTTDCNLDHLCLGGKCKEECVSEANCKKGKVCRGYVPALVAKRGCPTYYGKCYSDKEKGKEKTKCAHDADCNKGLVCKKSDMKMAKNGSWYPSSSSLCPVNGTCFNGTICDVLICKQGQGCHTDMYSNHYCGQK